MKAPSLLCLMALRNIALQDTVISCGRVTRRYYSAPPEPKYQQTIKQKPAFSPPPQTPGFKIRQSSQKDEEFVPTVLSRPIGMPNPPKAGEHMGIDQRTLQQRRDDFVNYDKHLKRRAEMTKQIAKPYFRDWSNMRFQKGKQFYAADRLFRAEHALFMPNFYGKTLRKDAKAVDKKDGYNGLGRNTCEVMKGKVSILSVVSSTWAEHQVGTFLSVKNNPELQDIINSSGGTAQIVEINREENSFKWLLVQMFASGLRKTRSLEQQARYFMVRRGVDDIVKEAIGLLNDKVGYIYLVDAQCRLRWAANANAEPNEIQSLNKGLKRLIQETKTPSQHIPVVSLEDAVADVVVAKT